MVGLRKKIDGGAKSLNFNSGKCDRYKKKLGGQEALG